MHTSLYAPLEQVYFSPSHCFEPFVHLTYGKRCFLSSKSPWACDPSRQLILSGLQNMQLSFQSFTLISFQIAVEPSMCLLHAPLLCLRHAAHSRRLLPSLAHRTFPCSVSVVISCHDTQLQAVAPLVGGTNTHGSILVGL